MLFDHFAKLNDYEAKRKQRIEREEEIRQKLLAEQNSEKAQKQKQQERRNLMSRLKQVTQRDISDVVGTANVDLTASSASSKGDFQSVQSEVPPPPQATVSRPEGGLKNHNSQGQVQCPKHKVPMSKYVNRINNDEFYRCNEPRVRKSAEHPH